MPHTLELDHERGLVVVTATGVLTFDDCLGALEEMSPDCRFQMPLRLWDMSTGELALSLKQVRHLAMIAESRDVPRSRTATVVGNAADFGLARMYEGIRANPVQRFAVFRDRRPAMRWLLGNDQEHLRVPQSS